MTIFFFFLFLILGDPGVGQPAPPLPGAPCGAEGGGGEQRERMGCAPARSARSAAPPSRIPVTGTARARARHVRPDGGRWSGARVRGSPWGGSGVRAPLSGARASGGSWGRGRPRWEGQGRACAHARARGGVSGAPGGGASGGAAGGEGATAAASTFCPNSPPAGRRPPAQGPRACTVPARTSRGRPRRSLAPRRR